MHQKIMLFVVFQKLYLILAQLSNFKQRQSQLTLLIFAKIQFLIVIYNQLINSLFFVKAHDLFILGAKVHDLILKTWVYIVLFVILFLVFLFNFKLSGQPLNILYQNLFNIIVTLQCQIITQQLINYVFFTYDFVFSSQMIRFFILAQRDEIHEKQQDSQVFPLFKLFYQFSKEVPRHKFLILEINLEITVKFFKFLKIIFFLF